MVTGVQTCALPILNNGEPPYLYLDVQELEVLTKRGKQKVAM